MYGVVLWSDRTQDRAVIWCEDHGDLAFYRGEGPASPGADAIAPGDMVQFDLDEGRGMRLARRPRLVAQDTHPTLTHELKRASREVGRLPDTRTEMPQPAEPAPAEANVVSFQLRQQQLRCAEHA